MTIMYYTADYRSTKKMCWNRCAAPYDMRKDGCWHKRPQSKCLAYEDGKSTTRNPFCKCTKKIKCNEVYYTADVEYSDGNTSYKHSCRGYKEEVKYTNPFCKCRKKTKCDYDMYYAAEMEYGDKCKRPQYGCKEEMEYTSPFCGCRKKTKCDYDMYYTADMEYEGKRRRSYGDCKEEMEYTSPFCKCRKKMKCDDDKYLYTGMEYDKGTKCKCSRYGYKKREEKYYFDPSCKCSKKMMNDDDWYDPAYMGY